MAYVPGVENDIFISYAHADNEAATLDERWVTRFVNDLGRALRRRLGNSDDLRIYFDDRNLFGFDDVKVLTENARNSALLLSVISPSYVKRYWTMNELEGFLGVAGLTGRIFLVETLPLDEEDVEYPLAVRDLKRTTFWHRPTDSEIAMTLDAWRTPDRYLARIEDLAEHLRLRLRQLRSSGIAPAVGPPRAPDGLDREKTVLLAQVTDDLDEEREQVRRYLEQYKFTVLPLVTYPQGGAQFRQAFETDCQRTRHFVQLLGRAAARRPPDVPQGYSALQYEIATRLRLDRVLWRRPDLDVTTLKHADVRLLQAPEILVGSLEDLKAEVLRIIRRPVGGVKPPTDTFVFIDADRQDRDIAAALSEEFGRHNCPAALPLHDGLAEEILKDLEGNLTDCTALVLVYGATSPAWVRGQYRLYTKLKNRRAAPPKLLVIYTGPPESKPDIGIVSPDARQIDCRQGVSVEPVRQLVSELLQ